MEFLTDIASWSGYQPPRRFTFSKLEGWPSWIKRFEQYRITSSLDLKEEERHVSSFIYSVGGGIGGYSRIFQAV